MSEEETKLKLKKRYTQNYREAHVRYVNETTEATMLHAKAIVEQETKRWHSQLQMLSGPAKVGAEYPLDKGLDDGKVRVKIKGAEYTANCFPVERIDEYWAPRLAAVLSDTKKLLLP